jgi:hypothetical protein
LTDQIQDRQLGKLTKPEAAAPPSEWSKYWVGMWVVLAVGLLAFAPFMAFWDWWTAVALAFGIPEFIGARVQNDAFPPLTHVIVRYVHPEISVPFMVGMAGGMGAHWLEAGRPFERGLLFGFAGWVLVHFLLRYVPRREP